MRYLHLISFLSGNINLKHKHKKDNVFASGDEGSKGGPPINAFIKVVFPELFSPSIKNFGHNFPSRNIA